MMTHRQQYFVNYRLFLHELTKPVEQLLPVTQVQRKKAIARSTQSRLGRLRANQVFDRLMKGGKP